MPTGRSPDGWVKLAAEEPDAPSSGYVAWTGRGGGETNARTQFPHNLKREIRDRCWTEGRIAAKNHRMPDKQRPNKTVADT